MTALFVVLAMAVVAGVAVLIARDRPLIEDDPVGSRPLRWSGADGVDPGDLSTVRFTIALRGYRMDQVDRVLDDTQRALAQRDLRISDLLQEVAVLRQPADVDPAGADEEGPMRRRHLVAEVTIQAPAEVVFRALTDWPGQGRWMLGTRVWSDGPADGVGTRLSAFTGIGRLGFLDTMEVTQWEPPRLVRVQHTGRVVRGPGTFEVHPEGSGSRLVWREDLDLPLGRLGHLGFAALGPVFGAGVRRSLARFAVLVEAGQLGSGA